MDDYSAPVRCEADAFFGLIAEHRAEGTYFVRISGGELPVRIVQGDPDRVVFTFTGSVRREELSIPRFSGFHAAKRLGATVIGFSDPSLALSETVYCAWYAGHEGFETQTILAGVIDRILAILNPSRPVFLGGSAGGFAALFYSRRVAGSVAVVSNPQTSMDRHPVHHQEMYRRECRPSLPADVPLGSVIVSDLARAYRESFANTVVYLQNGADRLHMERHLAPFLTGFDEASLTRLVLKVGFWGGLAHAQVPKSEWISWVKAVWSAADTTADAIQLAHFANQAAEERDEREENPLMVRDRRLAARLAAAALRDL